MPEIRRCRACGCWELEACEGGCSWVAADRCSACPAEAVSVLPINRAHVAAAQLVEKAAFTWSTITGDRMQRSHQQAVEFPNMVVIVTRKNGETIGQELFIGALQIPGGDVGRAAELLNARAVAA